MAAVIKGECLRRALAVVVAAGVALAVFFLRRTGVLEGIAAIAFAVLLVLIMPSSTVLSRRILLGGALFLGWVPLLWWVPLPVPQVDRVGILLALMSGALVFWVLWAPGMRARGRRLLPQVAVVDALPVVAAGLATWTTWPFIRAPSAAQLIQLFSAVRGGWDHVAHLNMVMMIRAKGVIEPMMGLAPDHSRWVWTGWYPAHPQAAVSSLIDLTDGTAVGDTAHEVVMYGRGVALMVILIAVLLAAGVAQLPRLRRRPLVAWPVGALTVAAFLFGLGSWGLSAGWWNFVAACAAAGLAALLAAPMTDEFKPLRAFALGGLVVATVHGWPLLAPLALVGAAVALVPFRRDRWPRARRARAGVIVSVLATIAASSAVIPILSRAGGMSVLTNINPVLAGTFTRLTPALLWGGLALAACLAAYVRNQSSDAAAKGLSLASVPVVGFLLLGVVGAYQLIAMGTVSYYFDKLLLGVSLVCVAVLAAGLATNLGSAAPSLGRLRRSTAMIASAFATVAALSIFGWAGLTYRAEAVEYFGSPAPAGERVLMAAEVAASRPLGSTVYLAASPDDGSALLKYFYQIALSLTWTVDTQELGVVVDASDYADGSNYDALSVASAAEAARELLEADAERSVVVAPQFAEALRALLPAGLRSRVITW